MPKRDFLKPKFPRSFDEVSFTLRDIQEYKTKYIGSKLERSDIKAAYMKYKGCLTHMATEILFMDHASEPRIKGVIDRMIRRGELPQYRAYIGDKSSDNCNNANTCRDLVRYRGGSSSISRQSARIPRGVCNMLKKYKPKRRIPKKYLRPRGINKAKAITAGDSQDNKGAFKSTVSFVGEIVKGLFK